MMAEAHHEFQQRRQEASQYKLRAEKDMGLRPSSAERHRKCSGPERVGWQAEDQQKVPDRRQEGQEEYLRQLEVIRQQYHQEMRHMRRRAEAEVRQAQFQRPNKTFVVNRPRDPVTSEPQRTPRTPMDVETALEQINWDHRDHTRQLRRNNKKGIMFEIRFDDEELNDDEELQTKEREEEKQEVDLLNQTLSFRDGEELKLRGWLEVRRGWSHRTPKTLLEALANMEANSVCCTTVDPGDEEEEEVVGAHRLWADEAPNSLLKVVSELTPSNLDSITSESQSEEERKEEEEEVSDVEVDKERVEPRSDDDDTNFEESEDELRERVADSMRNLLVMDDMSSDENLEDGEQKDEEGAAVSPAGPQQTPTEVEESGDEVTAWEQEEHEAPQEEHEEKT